MVCHRLHRKCLPRPCHSPARQTDKRPLDRGERPQCLRNRLSLRRFLPVRIRLPPALNNSLMRFRPLACLIGPLAGLVEAADCLGPAKGYHVSTFTQFIFGRLSSGLRHASQGDEASNKIKASAALAAEADNRALKVREAEQQILKKSFGHRHRPESDRCPCEGWASILRQFPDEIRSIDTRSSKDRLSGVRRFSESW